MARFTILLTFVAALTLLAPTAVGAAAEPASGGANSTGGITALGHDIPCC